MPTQQLTKRSIDSLAPTARPFFVWDTAMRGLGVLVSPSGKRSFVFQYRAEGGGRGAPTRRVTIGEHGAITVKQAREHAARLAVSVVNGQDPAVHRRERRRRHKLGMDGVLTGERLVDAFLEKHVRPNLRTSHEVEKCLKRDFVPRFGKKRADSITRMDVAELIDAKAAMAPISANRLLAFMRKMFHWAIGRGLLVENPCQSVPAPARERARDRVLSDDELAAVWAACADLGRYGLIVRLLILTGARREEVGRLRWSEIELGSGLWRLPSERSKNGQPHVIHLSPLSMKSIPATGGSPNELVFAGQRGTAFSGWSKSKRKLDEVSGVTDWRLHDLRRTLASGLAAQEFRIEVADLILNHHPSTMNAVTRAYQQHDFLRERKEALDAWSKHVERLAASVGAPRDEAR